MKASELRINNWVQKEGGALWQVGGVYGELIVVTTDRVFFTLPETEFNPIPLSEDWLIKFGFTPTKKEGLYDIPATTSKGKKTGFYLRKCVNGSYSPEAYTDIHEEILYIHQLQNIFHSLTGSELTIKEEQK